jgi:hypothetical protein
MPDKEATARITINKLLEAAEPTNCLPLSVKTTNVST